MSFYPNARPSGVNVAAPPVFGTNVNLGMPRTVAPPTVFNGVNNATGPVSHGPGSLIVPSLGTNLTGPTSTLYNGGTPGNRQMGMFWASESVKQQFVIVNDRNRDPEGVLVRRLAEGMLLFNASEPSQIDVPGSTPVSNPVCSSAKVHYGKKVCVMYDLWALNETIRSCSDFDGVKKAEDMLHCWRPLGVLKTEAAPSRTRLGDIKSMSRLVNLVVGHRVRMFNIWGGDIDIGTRLYVICKKVSSSDLENDRRDVDQMNKRPRESKRWFFYTYANKMHRVPPLHELVYQDDDGTTKMGAYFCIGFASEKAEAYPNMDSSNIAKSSKRILDCMGGDSNRMRLLNQIEIYLCN